MARHFAQNLGVSISARSSLRLSFVSTSACLTESD
jgi:hypothetical protein